MNRYETYFERVTLQDLLAHLTPDDRPICALSSHTNKGWGSFLGTEPAAIFHYTTNKIDPPQKAAEALQIFVDQQTAQERYLVGFVSYEFGAALRGININRSKTERLATPDVYVMSFDSYLEFTSSGTRVISPYHDFSKKIETILKRPLRDRYSPLFDSNLQPKQTVQQYVQAFDQVHHYIESGDVYQLNLTHRMEGVSSADGRDIFLRVLNQSQVDFQAYIEGPGFEVISASPERFIRIVGQTIETFPIKGTRPRDSNQKQDVALRVELEASEKERAELNMITDLMRNDLGAICEIGSVQVIDPRYIHGYTTVWHAQSHITGTLTKIVTPITAFLSMLPGGSITGCPKIRAMEIIRELETVQRGVYTGSIFTLQPDGTLDSSITIRTMVKQQSQAYLSVGSGIVYDSTANAEYQETLDKAAFFINLTT